MDINDRILLRALFLNGMVGLLYYAMCSRYQLLGKQELQSQGALFALSSTIHILLQPPHSKKNLNLNDVIPITLITLTKTWINITWKAQLLSSIILGCSPVLINKFLLRNNALPKNLMPKPPKSINCSKVIETTTIQVKTGDIFQMPVEAIVNAANTSIEGGGGIDGTIHLTAGPKLKKACIEFKKAQGITHIKTGEAVVTESYNIQNINSQIKYVVHTAGPTGNTKNRQPLLSDSYRNSLIEAAKLNIRSIAFPAISAGIFGFPVQEAQDTAFQTVKGYVEEHPNQFDTIIFVYLESNPSHLVAARNAWEAIFEND